jgi:hypothetical protein
MYKMWRQIFGFKVDFKIVVIILLLVKVFAVFFATQIFAKYSPLLDSNLYLNGAYGSHEAFRTLLIQRITVLANSFGGRFFANYIFAVASCAGFLYAYYKYERLLPFWGCMFLLLPSSFVWTSIVGKEAIFFGLFGLLIVLWSIYADEQLNLPQVITAIFLILLCSLFRPHYLLAIVWLFVATFVVKRLGFNAIYILLVTFIGIIRAIYLYFWDDLLIRGYTGISVDGRASRFLDLEIQPYAEKNHAGFSRFENWLPFGALFGIIGPTPTEVVKRPEFLPFFIEGLFILCMPIIVYVYAKRHGGPRFACFKQLFFLALLPSIILLLILHSPFGVLNPGSATRWRVNFEQIFYLAPTLLAMRILRKCHD